MTTQPQSLQHYLVPQSSPEQYLCVGIAARTEAPSRLSNTACFQHIHMQAPLGSLSTSPLFHTSSRDNLMHRAQLACHLTDTTIVLSLPSLSLALQTPPAVSPVRKSLNAYTHTHVQIRVSTNALQSTQSGQPSLSSYSCDRNTITNQTHAHRLHHSGRSVFPHTFPQGLAQQAQLISTSSLTSSHFTDSNFMDLQGI